MTKQRSTASETEVELALLNWRDAGGSVIDVSQAIGKLVEKLVDEAIEVHIIANHERTAVEPGAGK